MCHSAANISICSGDHKLLVELACATTLTAAYNVPLFDKVAVDNVVARGDMVVVFIVCGGFKVSLKELADYEETIERSIAEKGPEGWKVVIGDGDEVVVEKRRA